MYKFLLVLFLIVAIPCGVGAIVGSFYNHALWGAGIGAMIGLLLLGGVGLLWRSIWSDGFM